MCYKYVTMDKSQVLNKFKKAVNSEFGDVARV